MELFHKVISSQILKHQFMVLLCCRALLCCKWNMLRISKNKIPYSSLFGTFWGSESVERFKKLYFPSFLVNLERSNKLKDSIQCMDFHIQVDIYFNCHAILFVLEKICTFSFSFQFLSTMFLFLTNAIRTQNMIFMCPFG